MATPNYAMETGPGAKALLWFQRFVWLGIFANIVLTLTAIFCTEWVIDALRLDPAYPLAWPRFGAFGILLLSGFYVIAAMDPCRSPWASARTILAGMRTVARKRNLRRDFALLSMKKTPS